MEETMLKECKKADSFLTKETKDLNYIFGRLKRLEVLRKKIWFHLNDYFKRHCEICNFSTNALTIMVQNGSVATHLRYLVPELLQKFKRDTDLQHFNDIKIKVRPFSIPQLREALQKKPLKISQASANIIRETAATIDDPRLQKTLICIADRACKESI